MRVLVAREDLERISDVVSGALGGDGAVDDGPDGWAQLEPLLPGLEAGHSPVTASGTENIRRPSPNSSRASTRCGSEQSPRQQRSSATAS